MDKRIWILVFFAVIGAYFLGKGITGLVISQSCCFPPGCSEEDMCETARPALESPESIDTNSVFAIFGILILLSAALFIKFFHPGGKLR